MERLAEIRANPIRTSQSPEPRSLYLAAARSLRQRAQKKPSQGDHQVFILAEAEALAPHDSSSEAANALLKLLEEPPPGTVLILTSNEPGRLLPTIRSRATQLHLPPLPRNEVESFLVRAAGVEQEEAKRLAALSGGSIGRALGFVREDGEPGALEQTRIAALGLVRAALSADPGASYEAAAGFPSFGARGLQELLNFVEEWLRDLAMAATASGGLEAPAEDEPGLTKLLERAQIPPTAFAKAMAMVEEAKALAAGNVNPQLVVFGLLQDLRSEWAGAVPVNRIGR
jgi:DNA polymerase-3 subunit delta'